ncbi:Histone deacetylase 11 [Anabarilius grahami]|uniref:Histone deacetylase 11 n=1 Tax=Anabarilius grahami TaxID=495550 RepID=A0A3N0XFL6_ANAGA|nr:Histone deacetylase 11 [Anabarilius grahami]
MRVIIYITYSSFHSSHQTELYAEVPASCLPIVYSPEYNITFMGLEKLHPFDAGKWGKVIRFLKEEQFITDEIIVPAREASEADLLVVHTTRYLNRLKWSLVVATITEIPPLLFLPNFLVQRKVLKPLRTQTGGTIMNTDQWDYNDQQKDTIPISGTIMISKRIQFPFRILQGIKKIFQGFKVL